MTVRTEEIISSLILNFGTAFFILIFNAVILSGVNADTVLIGALLAGVVYAGLNFIYDAKMSPSPETQKILSENTEQNVLWFASFRVAPVIEFVLPLAVTAGAVSFVGFTAADSWIKIFILIATVSFVFTAFHLLGAVRLDKKSEKLGLQYPTTE